MKKMKKLMALLLTLVLTLSISACSDNTDKDADTSADTDTDETASADDTAETQTYTVGIIQYAPHASLDNCYDGIVQGLAEAGYVEGENLNIDFQNAQGDTETSDLMAKNMVASGYDMIIAIATPSAMSAYSAAMGTDIPVVFSAVSDPVSAGIVESLEKPGGGATGTSDALNLDGQMAMIREFLPDADTIGILYTTSEPNSVAHLAEFEALAEDYGFTIESVGITDASEVQSGAAALVAKGVDCINNFTDNNVVNNLSTLLNEATEAGIPVFGSEEEQVVNGCVASETLDYVALGAETGQIAADILEGADVSTIPVSIIKDSTPVYSSTNLEKFGIPLPDAYSHATDVG